MGNKFSNTASEAILDANITSGATGITLSAFSGWPATTPYWALIAGDTASAEVVQVTNVVGSTVTVVRGLGGTAAASHSVGDTFEHIIPASTAELAESHPEATVAHGTATDVVGVDDDQTLTNKLYEGAHTHTYTDALPASPTAGFKVNANSAAARDGFWHNSTAGDIDRRAFYSTQSGTPRVEVFNDGTVKITPSGSATRPGLEVEDANTRVTRDVATDAAHQTRVTADTQPRLIVQADGRLVWGSGSAVGDTELRRSAANKLDTPDSLDIGGSLAVLGTTSALGALAVTGNATVGGTLGVTGLTTVGEIDATQVDGTTVNATNLNLGGVALYARPLFARKSASETVNNSSTLQDDDDLFLALEANKLYHFSGVLKVLGTDAADFKMAFSLPASASGLLVIHGLAQSGTSGSDDQVFFSDDPTATANFGTTTGTHRGVAFHGLINVAGTAGNIRLRWAQNTAQANDLIVYSNSHIVATKLN